MTHTEKYELPIIEGTDVIDYEPFNEAMGKIEGAISDNETLVQEAVDDVAEMGDTLNQKVQEVNQALEETETNVQDSLDETTTNLTNMVNESLDRISKFTIARRYEVPDETYYFGSQSGNLRLPISSIAPIIQRGQTLTDNRFSVDYASQSGTPVSKVDVEFTVEPTGGDGVFNGACNTTIELWKVHSATGSAKVDELTLNTSVKTPIHFSTFLTASGGTYFYFVISSGYTHKLVDTMKLTVENIGMNN